MNPERPAFEEAFNYQDPELERAAVDLVLERDPDGKLLIAFMRLRTLLTPDQEQTLLAALESWHQSMQQNPGVPQAWQT